MVFCCSPQRTETLFQSQWVGCRLQHSLLPCRAGLREPLWVRWASAMEELIGCSLATIRLAGLAPTYLPCTGYGAFTEPTQDADSPSWPLGWSHIHNRCTEAVLNNTSIAVQNGGAVKGAHPVLGKNHSNWKVSYFSSSQASRSRMGPEI